MNGFYERNNPLASNTIQANYRGRGPGWRTGINTRVKLTATTAWVAFLFLSFFPSPSLSSVSVPLWSSATLMRLCYFSPYPWQLDTGRETRRDRLFSIRVNRSQTVSHADRVFLSRHVSTRFRNQHAYATMYDIFGWCPYYLMVNFWEIVRKYDGQYSRYRLWISKEWINFVQLKRERGREGTIVRKKKIVHLVP